MVVGRIAAARQQNRVFCGHNFPDEVRHVQGLELGIELKRRSGPRTQQLDGGADIAFDLKHARFAVKPLRFQRRNQTARDGNFIAASQCE